MTNSQKLWLLLAVTVVSLVGIFLLPRIPQDPAFHRFADTRTFWGLPNFGNVASNLVLLVVGIYGLWVVAKATVKREIRLIYLTLFAAVVLNSLGSACYHLNPNNDMQIWDRIPLTIVFMSFLCAMVSGLAGRQLGIMLLVPLVAVGIGSVVWWHYTETLDRGDMRLLLWVQYFPVLAIVLLLWLYYEPGTRPVLRILGWVVFWYSIAKALEFVDYPIYDAIGISGHTLRHLAAAVSTLYLVVLFREKYVVTYD